MDSKIKFFSRCDVAIEGRFTLHSPTAEQIDRLEGLSDYCSTDPVIGVPSALIVLLGLNPSTVVAVPPASLNRFAEIEDTGASRLSVKIDEGGILRGWLDSGAPLEWDGQVPTDPAPDRRLLARDAAGRFCRV